jgi:large subunit ribosomal protein L4
VLEDFNFENSKTKQYVKMLSALSLADKKTLLVLPENNKNVFLSGRNLKNAKVTTADQISTYDVVNAESVIFIESSISKIETLLNKA